MARAADEVVEIPGPPGPAAGPRCGARRCSARCCCRPRRWPTSSSSSTPRTSTAPRTARSTQALRMLFAHGEPIDVITAVDALRRAGILDEVGGALYLRDLVDEVPTPAGAPHYAKIVADAALRRRLIGAAADIMDTAYAGAERRRQHRRRRRAADLRRRPPRGHRGRRDPRRPDQPGDVGARVDPEPRVGLHGPPHRVPRPRRPHLGAPAGQPRDHRGAPGHREVLARDQHRAQRRRRRTSRSRSSRSR